MDPSKIFHHLLFFFFLFLISAAITSLAVRYLKVLDVPNERSSHSRITPRGGGIAIVFAFLTGIALIHLIGDSSPIYTTYFLGFFLSSVTIAIISFYDDCRRCPFHIKFSGYLAATVVAMASGLIIDSTNLPYLGEVHLGIWAYPLTFLWMFGLTNAYNFIDGLDGIAASTAVIAATFLSIISFQQGSHFIYLAALTLSAASLGFLVFNFPPAKIFMGDVGSTFLGMTFATMAIIGARYDHSHTSLLVVPMLLFHFIFDTSFTFFRRLLAGERVLQAHRTHLYQLLNRMGLSHTKVTVIYALMALMQGFGALWAVNGTEGTRWLLFAPLLAAHALYAACVTRLARKRKLI